MSTDYFKSSKGNCNTVVCSVNPDCRAEAPNQYSTIIPESPAIKEVNYYG